MGSMLNSLTYSLPENLEKAVRETTDEWRKENKIARIWAKDASVWTNDDEAKWLGWLDSVAAETAKVQEYKDFAEDVKSSGFTDVLLMGMGGSSLCPEVLSITFGAQNFHVLDSTVPAQIKTLESRLNLEKTLFIVASKSGSTLEPNTFKQYFFERVSEKVGRENAGKQFVAITDPDSKMQKVAETDGFRKIFFGNPEIGGRFSALSPFGMAAASAMGLDVEDFLRRASEMVADCKTEFSDGNAGALLGAILGVCQTHGRDKLTIFTSPEIYDAGAWLEQLIAESTGKQDVSIIPVDREPLLEVEDYSEDRVFAYLKLKDSKENYLDEKIDALASNGHPVVKIELAEKENLGQEFFRWEFATAVAGAIMQINPFNQPDVESAKIEARKLTEEYEETGELPEETPIFEGDGVKLFTSAEYAESLEKLVGTEKSLKKYLESHLAHLQENDYFALLAYIEMNAENEEILTQIREKVLRKKLTATCLGFGPRFLHSTGQAYKGGANSGVFLQITSDDATDFPVPGQKFTFGVVKAAQARGDFQVLLDRKRRALRVHLGADVKKGLEKLSGLI
ncbi:MAG TPA: bifunctional transaldolase/phosoglucose isomerase [Pyrinomonadaceae bacterium]|nr:bifunctional transaldolase/phosoglucose isomerase [Pyrinomonadaceae bacterium]